MASISLSFGKLAGVTSCQDCEASRVSWTRPLVLPDQRTEALTGEECGPSARGGAGAGLFRNRLCRRRRVLPGPRLLLLHSGGSECWRMARAARRSQDSLARRSARGVERRGGRGEGRGG